MNGDLTLSDNLSLLNPGLDLPKTLSILISRGNVDIKIVLRDVLVRSQIKLRARDHIINRYKGGFPGVICTL